MYFAESFGPKVYYSLNHLALCFYQVVEVIWLCRSHCNSNWQSIYQVRMQDVQQSFVQIVLECLIAFLYALIESR